MSTTPTALDDLPEHVHLVQAFRMGTAWQVRIHGTNLLTCTVEKKLTNAIDKALAQLREPEKREPLVDGSGVFG